MTPKAILEKKFSKDLKGYKAIEVDTFLDKVIADYESFDGYYQEANAHIGELEERLKEAAVHLEEARAESVSLRHELKSLELDNASLHNKFDGIKPGTTPTQENYLLLKKIQAYETYLHSIGIDPNSLLTK